MDASVLIPSVAGGETLIDLVEQLADVEVLIADNGLGRRTREGVRARGAAVVDMFGNAGFGRAVNRLASHAGGRALIVLNDDLKPEPRLVECLLAPLHGDVAMTAGVLVMAERPRFIESAGLEVDAVLSPYDYLQGHPLERAYDAPAPLGPCGGLAAYSSEVFRELGGFDEGFFAYCEDLDLAIRIHGRGASCALAPDARAHHLGSSTLGYHSLEKAKLVGESRGYLWRKYGVTRRPAALARLLVTELATSCALYRRHSSWEPARTRIQGFRRCRMREQVPERIAATVSFREGLRRRYSRSLRAVPGRESAPVERAGGSDRDAARSR